MSAWDQQALESNFEAWRTERAPKLAIDVAFERYAIEQVLKDDDLSDEELEYGMLGGYDDGGVDGLYFFVNRILMQEETDAPDQALTAELKIIQAKYKDGFAEDAIAKLTDFTKDLLDYSKPTSSLTFYSAAVRDAIDNFRDKYRSILASSHSLTVMYFYVTKTDGEPHPKVIQRSEKLKESVKKQLSAADVHVEFWDCSALLAAARSTPKTRLTMKFSSQLSTKDGSVVCLTNLKEYAAFLRDDHGGLRRSLLEPNVRDYQGKRNPVNQEIRQTLASGGTGEFWWLNNGITILAEDCNISGDRLTIDMPEIVNGLQTSQEIFQHFADNSGTKEERHVLVRIVLPPDEMTRNRVTKATNNQTPVSPLSLRATDQIHFDIEERLKLYDLYYDRRKGQHRNQRKPISKIVTIKALAQAVMAALLGRPNDAYARPLSVLKQEELYDDVFSDKHDRDLYVSCALLDKAVIEFMDDQELTKDERRGLRYYVITWLSYGLTGKLEPRPKDIAILGPEIVRGISRKIFEDALATVLEHYKALGGTEKVAKGAVLHQRLRDSAADFLKR